MNVNNIIIFIKSAFSRIKIFIKEIVTVQYFWHYAVLAIVTTILFVIITFPYEVIVHNKITEIERSISKSITIGTLDVNIITDSIAEDVTVELKNGNELHLKYIAFNFTKNPFSIFISQRYGGTITINNMNYASENIKFKTDSEIMYNLHFERNIPYPVDGNVITTMNNFSIRGITIQGFEIPDIKLTSIKSELIFTKGNSISIKHLLFSGNEVRGNVHGNISLSNYFPNSSLHLNVLIDSQSTILEDYRVLLDSFIKPGTENITFKIMGTISNPRISAE